MGALRVGLLSRVMALVQNSIYHDATDFCGRGGRKMDELLLTWAAGQSKWIIEGRQGSNLAPTKWLICPFDGNLGRSRPDSRSVTAVLSFQCFHQFHLCSRCIDGVTNPTRPFTSNCRPSGLTQKLLRLSSVLLETVLTIVGDCARGGNQVYDQNTSLPKTEMVSCRFR